MAKGQIHDRQGLPGAGSPGFYKTAHKPVSRTPPWALHQLLLPGSHLVGFPHGDCNCRTCKPYKLSLLKLPLVMIVHRSNSSPKSYTKNIFFSHKNKVVRSNKSGKKGLSPTSSHSFSLELGRKKKAEKFVRA